MSVDAPTKRILSFAVIAYLSGCATKEGIPPEAISTPAGSLADSLIAFGTKVQTETLSKYRRTAREDLIRSGINDFVLSGDLTPENLDAAATSIKAALCKPRYGYLRITAPIESTTATATSAKELLKPPSDDWKTLMADLSKKYTIDVTADQLGSSYDAWLQNADQGGPCAKAVDNADPFARRGYVGQEFDPISAALATKTMFDTVWSIVKPALTSVLKNVDLERRNDAVVAYFKNVDNIAVLKEDIQHVEKFLGQEFELSQKITAGKAVYAVRHLNDPTAPHWKAAIAIAQEPACNSSLGILTHDKTHPVGVGCMERIYNALRPAMNSALDAADTFDASLEKQLPAPGKKLSEQVDTIHAIAMGNQPSEDKVKALWGALTRYATLYNSVRDTASVANEKKLKDAIDAFKKALN